MIFQIEVKSIEVENLAWYFGEVTHRSIFNCYHRAEEYVWIK